MLTATPRETNAFNMDEQDIQDKDIIKQRLFGFNPVHPVHPC
jgi:hypothetical protein